MIMLTCTVSDKHGIRCICRAEHYGNIGGGVVATTQSSWQDKKARVLVVGCIATVKS